MTTTPPAYTAPTSPVAVKRKMRTIQTPLISGTVPFRVTDVRFVQDDVTKQELGKVCFMTELQNTNRLVVTTLFTMQLDIHDTVVDIDSDSKEMVGHHVTFYCPF